MRLPPAGLGSGFAAPSVVLLRGMYRASGTAALWLSTALWPNTSLVVYAPLAQYAASLSLRRIVALSVAALLLQVSRALRKGSKQFLSKFSELINNRRSKA